MVVVSLSYGCTPAVHTTDFIIWKCGGNYRDEMRKWYTEKREREGKRERERSRCIEDLERRGFEREWRSGEE